MSPINRSNWWLFPANSGNSTNFCYVNSNGNANNNNASNTNLRVPVGFQGLASQSKRASAEIRAVIWKEGTTFPRKRVNMTADTEGGRYLHGGESRLPRFMPVCYAAIFAPTQKPYGGPFL